MSDTRICDDKEQLVAYLYDELDGLMRRRIEEHVLACAACADELKALTEVRRELAAWTAPSAHLGFVSVPGVPLVAQVPPEATSRWWASPLPAWAQAAAAVLMVATGLSIANLQIRYGADGLVVTTGWMGTAATEGATRSQAPSAAFTAAAAAWQPALTALESTLRREIREARRSTETVPATPTRAVDPAPRAADLSLQRVADLIEQSERRQKQELAMRLAQFGRDLEVQRRSDLVRINQGFGQFEGRAGAEIARQRQMLDYIMRVSAQPPPQ